MNRKIEMASNREPLPGIDMLVTDAAREVANRNQFRGGIGQHVYVNGYDLARVEAAGLKHPDVLAKLEQYGWNTVNGVQWFRPGESQMVALADAVLAVIAALEEPSAPDGKEPA